MATVTNFPDDQQVPAVQGVREIKVLIDRTGNEEWPAQIADSDRKVKRNVIPAFAAR